MFQKRKGKRLFLGAEFCSTSPKGINRLKNKLNDKMTGMTQT